MQRSLRLVSTPQNSPPDALESALAHESPRMRLFSRWMAMFDKNPSRCGLGPQRSRLIDAWLLTYTEETLALAIDGAASDGWVRQQGGQVTSIEWLLRSEASIERFAEQGEALRSAMETRIAAQALPHVAPPASDPERVAAELAKLRALRDYLRSRVG